MMNPALLSSNMEHWLTVPGWPLYQVSDRGRLRSLHRGRVRVLVGGRSTNGYRRAVLCHDGRRESIMLHYMVLVAFHGPRPDGFVSRHLDGDKDNNRPDNLAWGTPSQNQQDRKRHGTFDIRPRGEDHRNARLTETDVRALRVSRESCSTLAAQFGVGVATIWRARNKVSWAWL